MNYKELLFHWGKQLFLLQAFFHISAILSNFDAVTCGKGGVCLTQKGQPHLMPLTESDVVRTRGPIPCCCLWAPELSCFCRKLVTAWWKELWSSHTSWELHRQFCENKHPENWKLLIILCIRHGMRGAERALTCGHSRSAGVEGLPPRLGRWVLIEYRHHLQKTVLFEKILQKMGH